MSRPSCAVGGVVVMGDPWFGQWGNATPPANAGQGYAGHEAYRLCRYRAKRPAPSGRMGRFVQPYVQLIDDRRPVGILDPFLLEEGTLRFVPEGGFGKLHVLR